MLDTYELTVHTLTLRQLGSAEQLADINALPVADVEEALEKAAANGAVVNARGNFMISPDGRKFLEDVYTRAFDPIRSNPAITAAMDAFETGVNKQVLALTTDWQTIEVDGARVSNDHADADYDAKIVEKLGRVHEKTQKVLRPLAEEDQLVDRFLDRIGAALVRAEGGDTDYVSGVRVDSVHTVWFQMHEHILRLTGRERPE
ncbi:hypothetical protein [Aldersonia kunmingensis]|uniref:hypothetical protein n=1 Tax=Aldersonia kunmingensis TaxID=408066 RepID=UPI00082FF9D0|nr:hypothetical protein [Aldersonia kunmingensis]